MKIKLKGTVIISQSIHERHENKLKKREDQGQSAEGLHQLSDPELKLLPLAASITQSTHVKPPKGPQQSTFNEWSVSTESHEEKEVNPEEEEQEGEPDPDEDPAEDNTHNPNMACEECSKFEQWDWVGE